MEKHEVTTAILVDGGFYRRRAYYFCGEKTPKERACELYDYCIHLLHNKNEYRNLYRIFYYDCPPIEKNVFNPITRKNIDLGKSDEYKWVTEFFQELKNKRKVALRMGRLSENTLCYNLKYESFKKLLNGTMKIADLSSSDLKLNIEQKGVDMRIGIDISSLAYKRQVQQIILISGDSDFVPAAKQARREGIDFILAPMGATIKSDLFEHIDGLINRGIKADSENL
ncbi:NYN domain-containing protein [Ruminococcus sp.]|uniref:NYN domain-containing protein n=1 Tax=Ruminococcus sp. TaxID=41978 RepID=UPI00300E92E4